MMFLDKVVWITGASSGIGEALARAFADEGARVVLSSRRQSELERVRDSCTNPGRHIVVPLDLCAPDTFPAAVQNVLQACGRIDVLVNNAGVSQRALAVRTTEAVERTLMEVGYFGPVALTKAALPSMIAQRCGHVVVVSSVMGYVGTPGRSSYAAAKHALHGYFDSLRAEVWRDGVHVTLACPGYVKTAISTNALGPDGQRNARHEATHERGVTPERCARAILRAVHRRKLEVAVGGWEVAGIYLQRFLPRVYARVVRNMTFSVNHDR